MSEPILASSISIELFSSYKRKRIEAFLETLRTVNLPQANQKYFNTENPVSLEMRFSKVKGAYGVFKKAVVCEFIIRDVIRAGHTIPLTDVEFKNDRIVMNVAFMCFEKVIQTIVASYIVLIDDFAFPDKSVLESLDQ